MEKTNLTRRSRKNQTRLFPVKTDHLSSSFERAAAAPSSPHPLAGIFLPEGAETLQKGEKRVRVDITSGLGRPLTLIVSVKPMDSAWGQKTFLPVKKAARILRLSEKTLYRQLQQGNLAGLKIGRQWRVLLTP